MRDHPDVILLMGVAGSGKSTTGAMLSKRLERPFADADDLHPRQNIEKVQRGIPLTEEDRRAWLDRTREWIAEKRRQGSGCIVSCSALKRDYRDYVKSVAPDMLIIYLRGDKDTIETRISKRKGHFFPAELLEVQFQLLEEPVVDEGIVEVDIRQSPQEIADQIVALVD